jgi:hypothetical protein
VQVFYLWISWSSPAQVVISQSPGVTQHPLQEGQWCFEFLEDGAGGSQCKKRH